MLAGLTAGIDSEVFNIVDDELLTARQFLKTCKEAKRFRSIHVPYRFAYGRAMPGKNTRNGQRPIASCLQSSPMRCRVEESALFERETSRPTGLEATCSDEAGDGRIPCAVRDKTARDDLHHHDMLQFAIVGCGKIADQHVQAIRRIPDCRIVGVCDREPLMARQLGERFEIDNVSPICEKCWRRLRRILFTSPLRHKAITHWRENVSNLEAMSIWKNRLRSLLKRRNHWWSSPKSEYQDHRGT